MERPEGNGNLTSLAAVQGYQPTIPAQSYHKPQQLQTQDQTPVGHPQATHPPHLSRPPYPINPQTHMQPGCPQFSSNQTHLHLHVPQDSAYPPSGATSPVYFPVPSFPTAPLMMQTEQNLWTQISPTSLDLFRNGMHQIHQMLESHDKQCRAVVERAGEDMWKLSDVVRQRDGIIRGLDLKLQQAAAFNQMLASQLNQRNSDTTKQQQVQNEVDATPLLAATQVPQPILPGATVADLQNINEAKNNLCIETDNLKHTHAKSLDSQWLAYVAELHQEREKRTRFENEMRSLSRGQLAVIGYLQEKVAAQAQTISNFERKITSSWEYGSGNLGVSVGSEAVDAAHLEIELTEGLGDRQGKLDLSDDNAKMEKARQQQAAKMQQIQAWKDTLLVAVDKMIQDHEKLETKSKEQEAMIGDLQLQVEAQQKTIMASEQQKESSEMKGDSQISAPPASAESLESYGITLESVQRQLAFLAPLLSSLPSASMPSDLQHASNPEPRVTDNNHGVIILEHEEPEDMISRDNIISPTSVAPASFVCDSPSTLAAPSPYMSQYAGVQSTGSGSPSINLSTSIIAQANDRKRKNDNEHLRPGNEHLRPGNEHLRPGKIPRQVAPWW